MFPVDPRVLRDIPRSHDVYGRLLASVNGSSFSYPVTLESGSVSISASSGLRRTLSATILADINDAECDVFRTEIRAEYGIKLLDGTVVWTPVGTFAITNAEEVSDGRVQLSGEDRWRRLTNARFLSPITTSGLHVTAIKNLVEGADGRITFVNDMVSTSTHTLALWERNRDDAIMQLAKAIGGVVYFDALGVAHLTRVRGIGDQPDWQLSGGDGGVLVAAGRARSQGWTYNAVVVEGENSSGDVAVRVAAVIADPTSPLLYGGPFARRPRYYRSPLISTVAQAQVTAVSLLSKVSGQSRTVRVEALPHPGLDANDVIRVEVKPGVYEVHVVDGFSLNLGPGPISIHTRTSLADDSDVEFQ